MVRISRARRIGLQVWAGTHALESNVHDPEDWPERFRLDAVGSWPLSAGDCAPGFVGLYTVINALDLVLSPLEPLEPSEIDWLLNIGWQFLMDRRPVRLSSSVRLDTMIRLADALSFSLSRRRGCVVVSSDVSVSLVEPASAKLERLIVARQAVIVLLGRGHYSVLRGFTPESWLLFDSTGRRWVRRRGRRGHPWKYGVGCGAQTRIILFSTH